MSNSKGFKLAPASMLLDKETIGVINFHCGDGADGQFGEYSDGHLWIGAVTDDDGKEVYGLHLSTSEYPEEGSSTLVEFDPPEDAAQAELSALREELANANEIIDQVWNRSHAIDHKGFIPGALDAWKRPVPQHLPYDFSGNPGASATQYCNGWNDAGGYWSGHASDLQQRLTAAEQRNAELVEIITEVAKQAGDHHMSHQTWNLKTHLANIHQKLEAALNPSESGASE